MDIHKAYKKVRRHLPGWHAETAIDYGDVFLFSMQPNTASGREDMVLGSFYAVDKCTGRLFDYPYIEEIGAIGEAWRRNPIDVSRL